MTHYTGSIRATRLQFQSCNSTVIYTSIASGTANGGHTVHLIGVDGVTRGMTFGDIT